jgi:hypothetical protein
MAMCGKKHNKINVDLSLGKGEVVSSILTGSTSNSPFHQANLVQPVAVPLTNAT